MVVGDGHGTDSRSSGDAPEAHRKAQQRQHRIDIGEHEKAHRSVCGLSVGLWLMVWLSMIKTMFNVPIYKLWMFLQIFSNECSLFTNMTMCIMSVN